MWTSTDLPPTARVSWSPLFSTPQTLFPSVSLQSPRSAKAATHMLFPSNTKATSFLNPYPKYHPWVLYVYPPAGVFPRSNTFTIARPVSFTTVGSSILPPDPNDTINKSGRFGGTASVRLLCPLGFIPLTTTCWFVAVMVLASYA